MSFVADYVRKIGLTLAGMSSEEVLLADGLTLMDSMSAFEVCVLYNMYDAFVISVLDWGT